MNTMMVRAVLAAAVTAFAVSAGAADKMTKDKKTATPDQTFVTEAGQAGHAEVELGKLAQSNGSSAAVKEFGQRMVNDHTKAGAELGAIAQKLSLLVPKEPSDKQKAVYKKLAALKGDKFDHEYAQQMIHDHETAVKLFQKESKDGEAKALKDFAANTLPTLEEHLKMARALKDRKK